MTVKSPGRKGYRVPTVFCRHCQRQIWETTAGWRHAASGMQACIAARVAGRHVAEPHEDAGSAR